mmetsp:Transcript_23564/g.51719  ORF Transcript_23564/g.51719 Transcript_23564/m.51719 type:complete len:378 (+) Transcript_23564:84-1217(+)
MAAARLCFLADWTDPSSGVLWKYQFFYYPESKEVEMVDIKNRRHFLKKVRYDDLKPELLFLGSVITVYSRQLKLVDYGDDYTKRIMESKSERTLAMVKPDAFKHLGKIVYAIQQSGFMISNLRVCKLSRQDAEEFYAVHKGKPFYEKLTGFMSSGRIAALELVAPDAIRKWRQLIGPTDSNKARAEAPNSIRAQFGTDGSFNAVHGSDAPDTAAQEIGFFFGPGSAARGKCDLCQGTTLGIIKPHAVTDGVAGFMLDIIAEHFEVAALRMVTVEKVAAAEFYEVYKGVLAAGEFNAMVDELTSGPCIAVEVATRDGSPAVEPFRELCGPLDPELGRVLRPQSLRARFGLNKIKNAVHCTDLPEDGELEAEYFFQILA